MNSGRGKLTGAKNIFDVYPIGTVEGDKNSNLSILTVNPRFRKALTGLEEFEKLLVIYLIEGKLGVHKAVLRKLENNKLYLDYSEEIDDTAVIDIKPYFKELDE